MERNLAFGRRLEALRDRRNLSRKQLAERIGRDWRVIERWENGRAYPRPEARRLLCEALGVDPNDLQSLGP